MAHYLYRLYDRHGDLLYVGVSVNPANRFRYGHKRRADWAKKVRRARLSVFPTIDAAMTAEREVIASEKPRFNVQHNRAAVIDPRPPVFSDEGRMWFIVRVYDAEGRVLKVGKTRWLPTWIVTQRTNGWQWKDRAVRIRKTGPYDKATVNRLFWPARQEVSA